MPGGEANNPFLNPFIPLGIVGTMSSLLNSSTVETKRFAHGKIKHGKAFVFQTSIGGAIGIALAACIGAKIYDRFVLKRVAQKND